MITQQGRVLVAEFFGAMYLLIGVVGSGIAAERLSPDDPGLQLLQNSVATAAVLVAVISIFGTISADFNPAVTVAAWLLGHRTGREVVPIMAVQVAGACVGTAAANLMFELRWMEFSEKTRSGGHLWLAEAVATLGLILIVFSSVRTGRRSQMPWVVGAYIGGAYYFTSSTSFANPAVTIARTLSNTFTGIAPPSVPMFIVMQVVGTGVAVGLLRFLLPLAVRD